MKVLLDDNIDLLLKIKDIFSRNQTFPFMKILVGFLKFCEEEEILIDIFSKIIKKYN